MSMHMREAVTDYEYFPGDYPVVVVTSRDNVEVDVTEVISKHGLNPHQTVWIEKVLPAAAHLNDSNEESSEFSFVHFSRDRYVLAGHHTVPDYILKALISRCS
jgi:hypothetical protein